MNQPPEDKPEPGDVMHKFLVIVQDQNTGEWTVITNTPHKRVAYESLDECVHDDENSSPGFVIYTGDFVTV